MEERYNKTGVECCRSGEVSLILEYEYIFLQHHGEYCKDQGDYVSFSIRELFDTTQDVEFHNWNDQFGHLSRYRDLHSRTIHQLGFVLSTPDWSCVDFSTGLLYYSRLPTSGQPTITRACPMPTSNSSAVSWDRTR